MLFKSIFVDTFICLKCGESFVADDVECGKVGDLKVPKAIKDNGNLFRMFVCPNCQSPYLGFVPSQKSNVQNEQSFRQFNTEQPWAVDAAENTEVSNSEGFNSDDFANFKYKDRISKQAFEREMKNNKTEESKKEEKTPKQDIPTPKRSKPRMIRKTKVKCSSCKKEFEIDGGFSGQFGTKCPDCIKALIRKNR